MANDNMWNDPVGRFRDSMAFYQKFIDAAVEKGFTVDQAIELLKMHREDESREFKERLASDALIGYMR